MHESFYTIGRRGTPAGLRLPMRVVEQPSREWLRLPCFKLVLVANGMGTAEVAGSRLPIAGPALLCLNARESAVVSPTLHSTAVLFLPEIVNSAVSLAALDAASADRLGVSGQLDFYWAEAFVTRRSGRGRALELAPRAAQLLADRFARIGHELHGQQCAFWPNWARSFLIECLFLAAQAYHSPTRDASLPGDRPDHPAAPVVVFLQTRYREKLTLVGLARQFHTNKTTLQKIFRGYTGRTIAAYLRELRLSIARSLLSDTMLPVYEIAAETGFADLTNFARAFRKKYQIAPARFRRLRRAS